MEAAATGFSAKAFQDKMHRIQRELPAWVQQSGQQAKVAPLVKKIETLMKDRKWEDADKLGVEILALKSAAEKK